MQVLRETIDGGCPQKEEFEIVRCTGCGPCPALPGLAVAWACQHWIAVLWGHIYSQGAVLCTRPKLVLPSGSSDDELISMAKPATWDKPCCVHSHGGGVIVF